MPEEDSFEKIEESVAGHLLYELRETGEIWANFDKIDMDCLASYMTTMKARAGTQFIVNGEQASFMAIVLEGEVEAVLPSGHRFTVTPGSIIGEMAVFTGGKRNADMFAGKKEAILAVMWFDEFEQVKVYDAATAIKLQTAIAKSCMTKITREMEKEKEDAQREREDMEQKLRKSDQQAGLSKTKKTKTKSAPNGNSNSSNPPTGAHKAFKKTMPTTKVEPKISTSEESLLAKKLSKHGLDKPASSTSESRSRKASRLGTPRSRKSSIASPRANSGIMNDEMSHHFGGHVPTLAKISETNRELEQQVDILQKQLEDREKQITELAFEMENMQQELHAGGKKNQNNNSANPPKENAHDKKKAHQQKNVESSLEAAVRSKELNPNQSEKEASTAVDPSSPNSATLSNAQASQQNGMENSKIRPPKTAIQEQPQSSGKKLHEFWLKAISD